MRVKAELLDDFEHFFRENLPSIEGFHPHFDKAYKEILFAGGKRFRPLLLLSIVNTCAPELIKNSYPVALGLEMLHTYSLIHDDLPAMDNADFRRGNATLHVTYDEVTAILVGDALNSDAFYQISNAPLSAEVKIELVKALSKNGGSGGMVIGQAIDCEFEDKILSQAELEFLHINKTAKLIAASLLMGAIICGLDEKSKENIYNFGLKLGLLFQIQDDIIDATSTPEIAGKPIGNDGHKNSFVNLMGLEGAIKYRDEFLGSLNLELKTLDGKLAKELEYIVKEYFNG
ncbi:MAG: polyprenyl synthetase family protein [Sulfurospirillaceae bacterium]|nr:polyprenyl synthetase family protein [Sulfurospirillaceae bacterium]